MERVRKLIDKIMHNLKEEPRMQVGPMDTVFQIEHDGYLLNFHYAIESNEEKTGVFIVVKVDEEDIFIPTGLIFDESDVNMVQKMNGYFTEHYEKFSEAREEREKLAKEENDKLVADVQRKKQEFLDKLDSYLEEKEYINFFGC